MNNKEEIMKEIEDLLDKEKPDEFLNIYNVNEPYHIKIYPIMKSNPRINEKGEIEFEILWSGKIRRPSIWSYIKYFFKLLISRLGI